MARDIDSTMQLRQKNKFTLAVRLRRNMWLYVLMLPALALIFVFHYMPIVGILIAFNDFKPNKGFAGIFTSNWVGLQWFIRFFTSFFFARVMSNTFIINILKLLFSFPAPIIFALLLNEVVNKPIKKIVQTVSYLPHFVSWVVVINIMVGLFSPDMGFINSLIKQGGGAAINFMSMHEYFYPMIVGSSVWKSFGFGSIIYLAAIASIDQEMYEAAVIDGCGRLKQVWYITLPSIKQLILMLLILNVGQLINSDFQQIFLYMGSNKSLQNIGQVIDVYVYDVGLASMNMSFATAIGVFKGVVALIMVGGANFISTRLGEESIV